MKAAIYLEDGVTQVVLTGESTWEKNVLAQLDGQALSVFRGGFYECQGGWFRQERVYNSSPYGHHNPPDSVILRINKTVETPDAP